jgi:hypothetical protein
MLLRLKKPAAPAETPAAKPAPANNQAHPQQAKPKPAVNLPAETLAAIDNIKPVTTAEVMDDEIPW